MSEHSEKADRRESIAKWNRPERGHADATAQQRRCARPLAVGMIGRVGWGE